MVTESEIAVEERSEKLKEEMGYYLEKARYPYLDAIKHKDTSDLILDGWTTLDNLRDKILEHIKAL